MTPAPPPATVRYQYRMRADVTVSVCAPSDAHARELLANASRFTIDLNDAPVTTGELTISALDLTASAAEADKVGDELVTSGPVPHSDARTAGICTAAVTHDAERI